MRKLDPASAFRYKTGMETLIGDGIGGQVPSTTEKRLPISADKIFLKRREEIFVDGLAHRSSNPDQSVVLSELLEEYLLKLGHSSDYVMSIVLRLLTHGKVRVEFRHCRDRLELEDKAQVMMRSEAIELFDKFLAHMREEGVDAATSSNMTQRIVVQSPRPTK